MIAYIVSLCFKIYFILLFARVLSSWIPQLQQTNFIRFIAFYTDPYLNFFRKIIPSIGGLDISPILAFFAFYAIRWLVFSILGWIGLV